MHFRKSFGRTGRVLPPLALPSLQSAFARRRSMFGPVDLAEDRIRGTSYLAEDLGPSARREIRDRSEGRD